MNHSTLSAQSTARLRETGLTKMTDNKKREKAWHHATPDSDPAPYRKNPYGNYGKPAPFLFSRFSFLIRILRNSVQAARPFPRPLTVAADRAAYRPADKRSHNRQRANKPRCDPLPRVCRFPDGAGVRY